MVPSLRQLAFAVVTLALAVATSQYPAPAAAQDAIRLGELNSYSRIAAFTVPYRQGFRLAQEEINSRGGVLGRPLEIVSRDDGGTSGDAVRVARELLTREDVVLLFGTFLSNVGLAVSDLATRREVLFVAAEPLTDALTMREFSEYTFRIRPNTRMQTAMLVDAARDLDVTRWAVIAPNYEYGLSAAESFKDLLERQAPEAEVVVEQYPALGQIDAGTTIQAILQANPDGIFNALFGPDLAQFVREGDIRGLFDGRQVLSLLTGEPEWLRPLSEEAPVGWIVTGYPWYAIEDPAHEAFVRGYHVRWQEDPRLGSLVGYITLHMIAATIEEAGSTETDAMIAALEGLEIVTPIGPIRMRALDHQSTMGAYVGRLGRDEDTGRPIMVDWRYADGADYLPSEAEVLAARGHE